MIQHLKLAKFLSSASNVKQLGYSRYEVAFVGRSNVGKSSLINAICLHKGLAKTSKTPGRTRLINVFSIELDRWIVDLPGYGFASGSIKEINTWRPMIEGYLTRRSNLRVVYVLIDSNIGPTKLDQDMFIWLNTMKICYCVVATKYDRVKKSMRFAKQQQIAKSLGLDYCDIFWVSSSDGTGISELRFEVSKALELHS